VQVLEGVEKPISEIASFRGRFCEQAENGEVVVAQGKLERMQNKAGQVRFRLLLGNKPSDFMILA
jgi:predicted nucleotidyltransferase